MMMTKAAYTTREITQSDIIIDQAVSYDAADRAAYRVDSRGNTKRLADAHWQRLVDTVRRSTIGEKRAAVDRCNIGVIQDTIWDAIRNSRN